MIFKPIDTITTRDVEELIRNAVPERRTLEYKRTLPGGTDADKKEFLADVSSFANASGGDILYGVAAQEGVPIKIVGLAGVNLDDAILRMDSMIREGISPRLPGVRVHRLEESAQPPILLVRVPRSWATPHMVTFKNSSRFFTRSGAGKHQMDVTEIRASFALSESIPQRIRDFRLDRLSRIVSTETPVRLLDAPTIVFHVIPMESFTTDFRLSPEALFDNRSLFQPLIGGTDYSRFNVDGLINIGALIGDSGYRGGYCQLFRNGAIELVDAQMCRRHEARKLIASHSFESNLQQSTAHFLDGMKKLGIPPPALFMLALSGYRGFEMAVPSGHLRWEATPIDRDMLVLPETFIDDYDMDAARVMRPIADMVWNASGWPRSPYYDEHGNWRPR